MSNPYWINGYGELKYFGLDIDARGNFMNLWNLSYFLTIASVSALIIGQKYLLRISLCAKAYAPRWLSQISTCTSLIAYSILFGVKHLK